MNLASPNGVSSVEWVRDSLEVRSQSQLKWHKVRIVTGSWYNILTCKVRSLSLIINLEPSGLFQRT